jgi:hypothetical protein
MTRLSVSVILFISFVLFSFAAMAQSEDDSRIVHIQTSKFKAALGDDMDAFGDMLRRQAEILNKDSRLLSFRILRHNWGADSRDFVLVSEFKNMADLEAFYNDMNSLLEEAMGKEQMDKDNEMWGKYIGMHSDEVYAEVPGTRK